MSKLDLKELWEKKEAMEMGETLGSVETMSLVEMGQMILQDGKVHRGHTFAEVYKDKGYNKWVANHITEKGRHGLSMQKYAAYLRRRLEAEMYQTEPAPPEMPEKGSHQPPSKDQLTKTDEDEMTTTSHWTKVEILEEELVELRQGNEAIHYRMARMEETMGQIFQYIQKQADQKEP